MGAYGARRGDHMTQATGHEGGEQKPTDGSIQGQEPGEHQGAWDKAANVQRMGEAGLIGATTDTVGLSLVEYMSRQAAARVRAQGLIKEAPRGAMDAREAVIENATISRSLLMEPLADLGEQARLIAEDAQRLLCEYTMDVGRTMCESGTQRDSEMLRKFFELLSELSYIDLESNREAIVTAIRILSGIDPNPPARLDDRIAGLEDAFKMMSDGLRHGPGVPGS